MHSVIILSFGALIVVRNPLSLLVPVRFTIYCDPSIILVPTEPSRTCSSLHPHSMTVVRQATELDFDSIWEIFHRVVQQGDTYAFDPATTKDEARSIWTAPHVATYVAETDGVVVGTYILKPNQPGLGSHVANAGYMVHPDHAGRGIGRRMCEHSMIEARKAGYLAMQFNIVVSTNESAIALWTKMGFSVVGVLPKVFRHRGLGLVDAYVMHRFL